jgi:DNA-binding NtrC family response regulator
MPKATILVVDDEALIRWSLSERLRAEGYDVLEAGTGGAALDTVPEGVDLVLLDYRLPDADGVTILRKIKEFDQDILVILLTAYASVETAVEAMKLGAYHFANKPFNLDDVAATVARVLETTRLRREVRQYVASASRPYALQRIVGSSPAAHRRLLTRRHRAAAPGRAGRLEPGVHRAPDRRKRDRQGSGREGDSLRERPGRAAVHEYHLFGLTRAAPGE